MNIKLIVNDNFDIFSKKEIVGNGIIIRKTISAGTGISSYFHSNLATTLADGSSL